MPLAGTGDFRVVCPPGLHSFLDDHDLSRFDDGGDGVPCFQFQVFSAFPRDDGINQILTDANRDVSHNISKSDFRNFALQLVSRADSHEMSPDLKSNVVPECHESFRSAVKFVDYLA